MDWAEEFAEMLKGASKRITDLAPSFSENASDFKGVFVKKGGALVRPKLRSTPKEAQKYDPSSAEGRFMLQREAMFENALEGE